MQDRLSCAADETSKNRASFNWSGTGYAKNSTPQADRNMAALKIFGLRRGESGLDVGCGNGYTSGYIANEVFPGEVLAMDSSDSMVEKAQADYASIKNLKIVHGNAINFTLFRKVDFVTSFFCLQWVPADQIKAALSNCFDNLKQGGRVCILLPTYDFTHQVIKGVAFSDKWKQHFEGFQEAQRFSPPDFYMEMMRQIGFVDICMANVDSSHPMTDEKFIEYTRQWCGVYSWLKDDKLRNEFIEDVLASLKLKPHTGENLDMVQSSLRIFACKSPAPTIEVSNQTLRNG